MVAEGYQDAEAEIAHRIRAVVGQQVLLAVTLDFHANIGQEMTDAINILTTYDTYPHVDAVDLMDAEFRWLSRVFATTPP
jgi:microcystin degradation protein MlrC